MADQYGNGEDELAEDRKALEAEPQVLVDSDFDGYFESLVRSWIARKSLSDEPFKHTAIHVTAGPYRASAMTYESRDGVIHLDFYSAIRAGFGGLTKGDVTAIIALL